MTGCNQDDSKKSTEPVYHLKVGIPSVMADYFGLILLTRSQGYFKQQGLDIDFILHMDGPGGTKSLNQGILDLTMSAEFPFIKEIILGTKLKIIASVWRGGTISLATGPDKGIRVLKDLAGKTINVTKGTQLDFYLGRFLLFNGLVGENIFISYSGSISSIYENFISGKVDSAVLPDVMIEKAQKTLGQNIATWNIHNGQLAQGIVYGRE